MTPPRLWRRLLRLSLPRERRDELDADLREEFTLRVDEGSPAAARRWYRRQARDFALHRLGRALAGAARAWRRLHPSRWLDATDLKVALRLAARHPVATATSVVALAAAIALSLVGFTLARGLAWAELPFEGGDRLYDVRVSRQSGGTQQPLPREILLWRDAAESPDDLGAYQMIVPPLQISPEETGRPVEGARVTPGPFARLAPPPLLGRHLVDTDARPGGEPVVVLREWLWRHPETFDADRDVLGRTVLLAGTPHIVVGVLPDAWAFPTSQSLWTPLPLEEMAAGAGTDPNDAVATSPARSIGMWVMLPEDTAPEAVADELTALAGNVTRKDDATLTVSMVPYVEGISDGTATPIAITIMTIFLALLAGVGLNVSTLVLARSARRADELALRAALGAPRRRLVLQLFVESLVTGCVAAALGVLTAKRILDWGRPFVDQDMPFWMDLSVDPGVVGFAAILAVLASGIVGVVPAFRITRRNGVRDALQGGSGRLTPVALGRVTGGLLAVQLAFAIGVLAVAGMMLEALWSYGGETHIRDEDGVLTAILRRDPALSGEDSAWGSAGAHRFRTAIEAELAALPGVSESAVAVSVPRHHNDSATIELEVTSEGLPARGRVQTVYAGPGFLELLGHPPLQGRTLSEEDARPGARRVAVVSRSFVNELLGGRGALGRRFRLKDASGGATWIEIVGVVPDVGMDPGDRTTRSEVYLPLIGSPFLYALVRTDGDPLALASDLRRGAASVDPAILVTDIQLLPDVGWEVRAFLTGGTGILTLMGGLALLLSLASVYALASLAVTSRTREIGIRVALGASSRAVLRAVLDRSLIRIALGAGGGMALALALGRATMLLPFEIPRSFAVVLLVATLMFVAALAATWLPARRALRVDPMEALRAE